MLGTLRVETELENVSMEEVEDRFQLGFQFSATEWQMNCCYRKRAIFLN